MQPLRYYFLRHADNEIKDELIRPGEYPLTYDERQDIVGGRGGDWNDEDIYFRCPESAQR